MYRNSRSTDKQLIFRSVNLFQKSTIYAACFYDVYPEKNWQYINIIHFEGNTAFHKLDYIVHHIVNNRILSSELKSILSRIDNTENSAQNING